MRPSIKYGLIALGLSALVITVAVLGPRFEQKALAQANTVKQKTLVISAFRENGPNGAGDEFVEIFNPSNAEVTVSTLSGDGNGIGVFSNAGNNAGTTNNTVTLRCNIPGATVIKGRGWFLCGGSGYSLGNLGRNGGSAHSVPDATIIGDIPNDAGLALMNVGADTVTFVPLVGFVSGLLPTTVFDKVGFRPVRSQRSRQWSVSNDGLSVLRRYLPAACGRCEHGPFGAWRRLPGSSGSCFRSCSVSGPGGWVYWHHSDLLR